MGTRTTPDLDRENIPGTILIPRIPDAYTTVTYIVPSTERIFQIAEDVGAQRREFHFTPSLYECHYEADEYAPERWILVVRWNVGDVHYSAQAESTTTPTLGSAA